MDLWLLGGGSVKLREQSARVDARSQCCFARLPNDGDDVRAIHFNSGTKKRKKNVTARKQTGMEKQTVRNGTRENGKFASC